MSQVNVNATFMLTRALLPLLLKSDAGSLAPLRHQALVRDALQSAYATEAVTGGAE